MRRSGVIRHRSRKMERTYRDRRVLVATILEQNPVCQRCHSARSVDVHELRSRARGGSITDPTNTVGLCRLCHEFITRNPLVAENEGWALPSWGDA
jgi:nitrate/TMAO reductase-like tetraheme cytochrome c subunit